MIIDPSDVKEDSTGEWRVNCPFCKKKDKSPDTDRHLYINPRKDVYICFRCGEKGKASRDLGLKSQSQYVDGIDVEGIIQQIEGPDLTVRREYITLKDISKPIQKGFPSHHYLLERGLTGKDIERYQIRSGVGEFSGRVIVPVFDERGGCIYFVARSYVGQTPRYRNPSKPKRDAIFNLYGVESNEAIVCEGVFDAISVGPSAVATLGKDITDNQLALIAVHFDRVYLALDGETADETKWHKGQEVPMLKYYRDRLLGLGSRVGVVTLPPEHDPESYGQERFQEALESTSLQEPGTPSTDELFRRPRYHN